MFVFLFSSFSFSKYIPFEQCVGPLSSAEPVNNGKLIFAEVLIRHGSRSPGTSFGDVNATGEWYCDEPDALSPRYHAAPVVHPRNYHEHFDPKLMPYKPSCRQKDLLTMGMEQHLELGQFYRKYLVEENKLLGEKYNPTEVLFRASEEDRALRSGIAFMQGMFPPQSPNEVVQVMTDTEAAGVMHPSEKWCKELNGDEDYFLNTSMFKDAWAELESKGYDKLVQEHGIKWEPKPFKKFASYVTMVDCTNHTLESWITPELAQACYDFVTLYNYGPSTVDGPYFSMAASPTFREIFRQADEFISMQSPYKFILLSSHDTAIVALLPTLGVKPEKDGPAVRAHLTFELWDVNDQIFARFVYNGEPVKVSFLGDKDLYLYANLKLAMTERGYLSHCLIPEWPVY